MMKNKLVVLLLVVGIVSLPLSNLLGLSGENEPINGVEGSSANFIKVTKILQNKCVDCHSPGMTRMPIYADFPIAKQLMAKDIENASARLILTKELYSGAEKFSPVQLARIEGVVLNNSMPPALYLSMHWNDRLEAEEQRTILAWIKDERSQLTWSQSASQALKGEPIQPLPLTVALDGKKVVLGQKLFHDTLLSGDGTLSCASCHSLLKGGTDQAKVATGINGQQGPINSPTVYNVMYNVAQFWDGRAKDLHAQAAGPVANPGEMGANWELVIEKLKQVPEYQTAFESLYAQQGLTMDTVTDAIAYFEESLVTPNSRFDQYLRGNDSILTGNEKSGYELFKTTCASCHSGPALGGLSFEKMGVKQNYFMLRGGSLTDSDQGRFNVTKDEKDRHVFKVPVLRNIEMTAPYFHDGSASSLAEAVKVMAKVQRNKTLTADELDDLVAFLKTLTGEYKGKLLTQLTQDDLK